MTILASFLFIESSLTTSNPLPTSRLEAAQANPGGDALTMLMD
jgi:hypothetical protein